MRADRGLLVWSRLDLNRREQADLSTGLNFMPLIHAFLYSSWVGVYSDGPFGYSIYRLPSILACHRYVRRDRRMKRVLISNILYVMPAPHPKQAFYTIFAR